MHGSVSLHEIFPAPKPVVGMVHLLPLPGAPRWGGSMDRVLERALADARALADGGVDGVLVENFLDAPFYPARVPAETIAALAVVVREVATAVAVPVGVNVLRNDALAGVSIACAAGARFVRVNVHTGAMLGDQGWLHGEAHETLRLRARLGARVAILADVLVKHAVAPPGLDIAQAARDARHRGLADGLVVSGAATGEATDPTRILSVKRAVPDTPVWIGSGITPENARALLDIADGAIVGSTLMHDGRAGEGVDPARVRELMAAVAAARAGGSGGP
jgi:hypothetical protein